jgi:hypothetical protein
VAAAASGCAFLVSPLSATVQPSGGAVNFTVTTGPGCTWAASSVAAWAQVTSGASGSGPGSVTVTVPASDGLARSTTLTIAGRAVSFSQLQDNVPPTGTVVIAGGASATKTAAVTLTLSATDASSAVAQMCVSNTATCSAWVAYSTSKAWTLAGGAGTRTVSVWFKDARGNASSPSSASIVLDAAAPVGGAVTATPGSGQVSLSWSGFTDVTTGVVSYVVVAAPTTAPATCAAGTPLYQGSLTSFLATSLTNGVSYGFRVCGVDGVGNVSPGAVVTARPAPEYVAPTGTISVNGGALWTKALAVSLSLSATDVSGVAQMCVSNTTTCTAWETYATTRAWTLTAGSGWRTVSVWFKDVWGNVSATAATDAIGLDTVVPTNGTVTLTRQDGGLTLSWSGFTDSGSGIAGYRVVWAAGAAPANCTSGTQLTEGTAITASHTGLTNGSTYGYRVCALDSAGNLSTGVAVTGVPAPELAPPSALVVINGGAAYTRAAAVTLTLSSTDASGVAQMCLSNTSTCTTWVAYASSAAWTLTAGSGARTVYASFRDPWGNTSVASAAITLDAAAPTGGVVSATAGSRQVSVSWSGFTDALSGVGSYTVAVGVGAAPATCAAGQVISTGAATSFVHTSLSAGTLYGYRICATDRAGNTSAGVTKTATPLP